MARRVFERSPQGEQATRAIVPLLALDERHAVADLRLLVLRTGHRRAALQDLHQRLVLTRLLVETVERQEELWLVSSLPDRLFVRRDGGRWIVQLLLADATERRVQEAGQIGV